MADALAEAQDRLEARVTARTAELRALLALSNTIAVTTDLEPLLAAVLDRLEASGAGAAAEIVEADAAGATVRLAVRGALAADPDLDPRTLPVDGRVDGDVLALPLRVRERSVGVLRVAGAGAAPWDEERRRLVAAIAAQAAVAIENVRLYERARDEAADDERRHLARELHDSVSQALYAIVLGGHAAQKHVGARSGQGAARRSTPWWSSPKRRSPRCARSSSSCVPRRSPTSAWRPRCTASSTGSSSATSSPPSARSTRSPTSPSATSRPCCGWSRRRSTTS